MSTGQRPYFMALAEGDFSRQTQVISAWNEDLREKVRLVQLFLLSLYYNNLLKTRLILDPMVDSITVLERQPMVPSRKWLEFEGGVISAFFQRRESALARRWRSRHENG